MKTKRVLFSMTFMAILYFMPSTLFGQVQINDEAGLRAIANDLSGNYILSADITLTADWTPIGTNGAPFMGIINGNGKTIYGLKFMDPTRNGAGFIGVARGATVSNLTLIAAQIYGGQDVGGIVGRAYAPTIIEKCYTSGAFSGYDHVGGIVGGTLISNPSGEFSKVQDCFSTAAVISTGWQAGGIIGTSVDVELLNSYFAGVAACQTGRTGGLVALADGGSTTIRNSVSIARMLMGDEANRIMGNENGKTVVFDNNYSWENTLVIVKNVPYTDGESNKNGKDGEHTTEAKLKMAAFYTADLMWSTEVWNIAENAYPIFPQQSYPLKADGIFVSALPNRALPGEEVQLIALSGLGRTITYASSDPSVATISATGFVKFLKNGTTTLTFSTQGDAYSEGIAVTRTLRVEAISYEIRTEEDLRNIQHDLNGEFTLMNNITLTQNWEPLRKFKGKLNGNGKIIYGLKFSNASRSAVGLFAEAEGATITKLGIEEASILGNSDVAALVGNAYGCTITECYVANSYIAGRDHVGSLVGALRAYEKITNQGEEGETKEKIYTTISNCHSSAQVYSREYQAAGIAGIVCGGTVEKCYFSGVVKSESGRAAGFVALVDSEDPGAIKDNINLAIYVYCGENYRIADWGGRGPSGSYPVIFSNNWSVENSYFGTNLKNSATKQVYEENNNRDGRNLSNDNLARQRNFYTTTLGWDFDAVWTFITGTEGKMYPVLKWQQTPLISEVYGVPEPAYLTWYEGSQEAINLAKIRSTNGETLSFDITEGAEFVEKDGNLLYITANTITAESWTKITLHTEAALAGITTIKNPKLNIEIIMRDAVKSISTVQEFLDINQSLFRKFKLTKDIDMDGVEFFGIGSATTPFTGQLDGNGYAILNAKVSTAGGNKKGLFNATDGAKIANLGVVDFSFSGSSASGSGSVDLGGLVGSCKNTTIDQCFITGYILGRDHVGGFVGGDCDNVTITNSYIDATIEGERQVGGFFGVTAGSVTVENCYFNGTIVVEQNYGWAGGIIGLIDRTGDIKISNTASIGDMKGAGKYEAHIGGKLAAANIALFKNNLYNTNATIDNKNGWLPTEETEVVKLPIGKSETQLKQQLTYTDIAWNFTDIWSIEEGIDYPKLKKHTSTALPVITANGNYWVQTNGKTIRISGIEQSAEVTLYNVSGKQVFKANINDNAEVQVPEIGIYIVHIIEKGKSSAIKVLCR